MRQDEWLMDTEGANMGGSYIASAGDVVWYHGSVKDAHGPYFIANLSRNLDTTVRFELRPLDRENTRFLYNARRKSFTILRRVY